MAESASAPEFGPEDPDRAGEVKEKTARDSGDETANLRDVTSEARAKMLQRDFRWLM